MSDAKARIAVYLEIASKRTMASARDWPGWCRGGRSEEEALAALLEYGKRYATIVSGVEPDFRAPADAGNFRVVERVAGNSGTDYGVPSMTVATDPEPMAGAELERATRLLRACWDAFDRAVEMAQGKELSKGPRGGGRELDGIMRHVVESEAGYADRIGLKLKWGDLATLPALREALTLSRERILEGLADVAEVGTPPPGPRGGARWPARYFVRRVAYHVVDHTWEIEDRAKPSSPSSD
jgi:hypothetical protein